MKSLCILWGNVRIREQLGIIAKLTFLLNSKDLSRGIFSSIFCTFTLYFIPYFTLRYKVWTNSCLRIKTSISLKRTSISKYQIVIGEVILLSINSKLSKIIPWPQKYVHFIYYIIIIKLFLFHYIHTLTHLITYPYISYGKT